MHYCGAKTLRGRACKKIVSQCGEKCLYHRPVSEDEPVCSVCIGPMRTRNTRTLDCGHSFHRGCIDRWKQRGNYTCPICRAEFDPPQYRVSIKVEYLQNIERPPTSVEVGRHSAETLGRSIITADMLFDVEDINSMHDVLTQMGITEADVVVINDLVNPDP